MAIWRGRTNWDPSRSRDWAQVLNLADVPLFGAVSEVTHPKPEGNYAALLDGRKSSCVLCVGEDLTDLIYDPSPLRWSWSSNLRHTLIVNVKNATVSHRRWEAPDEIRSYRLPATREAAVKLFDDATKKAVNNAPSRSGIADVISCMLRAFRQVRNVLSPFTSDPVIAIRVFNAFLTGTDLVRSGKIEEAAWCECRTIGEALSLVSDKDLEALYGQVHAIPVGEILQDFIEPDSTSKQRLEPDLLIRHASGVLYQEAHFEIGRVQPFLIPGMNSEAGHRGEPSRDVKYTPPEFARVLVEQSLNVLGDRLATLQPLKILDPACGSGVFLQESLRELERREFAGAVELTGFDTSEISCVITRFCLDWAKRDAGSEFTINHRIENKNALNPSTEWDSHHVILMNPPFVGWKRMNADDHSLVRGALGELFTGHPDKAMAFVWRGMQQLDYGGVLATIIPSPLLESVAGLKWRKALAEEAVLRLIGRFTGFGFFQGAVVELGFFVMEKGGAATPHPIRVVLASEGSEERALRSTRKSWDEATGDSETGFENYSLDPAAMTPATWLPRTRNSLEILGLLARTSSSKVADLFEVKQGVITGNNKRFIISKETYSSYADSEKAFFRPVAGTPSLRNANIHTEDYLFYPYGPNGPTIQQEADLDRFVPEFYRSYLLPHREELASRPRISLEDWWLLKVPCAWQYTPIKKIVTEYFGDRGSFAYDQTGEFVVLQGYGWLWRREDPGSSGDGSLAVYDAEDETAIVPFHQSQLPWAYIALLNSRPFESLLALFCPRVRGGQYNLSIRFINQVFLPDLSDENHFPGDLISELSRMGSRLSKGQDVDAGELSELVAHAYGVPLELMMPRGARGNAGR